MSPLLYSECTLSDSVNPDSLPRGWGYDYPISQVGNGGTERLSEADQVTQLVKGGALVGTLVVQIDAEPKL